jgi:4-coumarate--CoA ligase
MPRFHLETFLQAVSEHGVTFSFVVPPILLALAKHPLVDNYDISTLWRVASGAASLPDEIASAVGKRLGIRCTDGYGMTEMSPIVAMQNVDDLAIAPNTVGVLAPNTQALVLDSKGKELGPNEAGELLLRGPQMMKGYFENEDANEKAFYYCTRTGDDQSKWLRTGDVVKIDERHYITITDRLKDVIKAKGFQVSPAELEAVLFKDSRVADVAVIGVRDEKDGAEKPWAFLVPHDTSLLQGEKDEERNQAAKAIQDKANGQMAGYKKIEGITWIEALPKR